MMDVNKFPKPFKRGKLNRAGYTVDEYAGLTGCKPATIRQWLRNGTIKGEKVGKIWLVSRAEVSRLLGPTRDGGLTSARYINYVIGSMNGLVKKNSGDITISRADVIDYMNTLQVVLDHLFETLQVRPTLGTDEQIK